MRNSGKRKTLSGALVLSLVTALMPMNANAVEPETTPDVVPDFVLPDTIEPEEADRYKYVGRDYEAETNLSMFVFQNEDGTNTMRVFGYPVKYIDESGKTKDISLKVKEDGRGGYETAENNIITNFPGELSEGISLSYEETAVRLVPDAESAALAAVSEDHKTVEYVLDEKTALSYSLTCTGFKEDIVVSEYTGQTDYGFTLYTGGLELWEQDGSYYLRNDDGEIKANIGDIIIFTADEKSNTLGTMSAETVSANNEYRLTIHVDAEFLADEATVYPIKIDPTVTINYNNNGASAIADTTISEANPNTNYGNDSFLTVGKIANSGISRLLLKFPMDIFSTYSSSLNIQSAFLSMRDYTLPTNPVVVNCCLYEGENWYESTVTWNNTDRDHFSSLITSRAISYNNGLNQTVHHQYDFNITTAVKRWVDGSFNQMTGLIFKVPDNAEAANNTKKVEFGSIEGVDKPSLTIQYNTGVVRNCYYSQYEPNKFNSNNSYSPNETTKDVQARMNCYGYAFRNILCSDVTIKLSNGFLLGYMQQPGEFVSYGLRNQIINFNYGGTIEYNMNAIINNLEYDALRFGITITPYTPTSSVIEQFGNDSRLVALVATSFDYHFYMQHSDGTWSHKPGLMEVTNLSLDNSIGSFSKILTNENIWYEANKGSYVVPNGYTTSQCLKFFIITKNATIDQPHSKKCCNYWATCSHSQTVNVYLNDNAGDCFETAVDIDYGVSNAKNVQMSFTKDEDYYYFSNHGNGQYRITTTITGNGNNYSDLQCRVYNANKTYTGYSDTGNGNVDLTFPCIGGNQYYIYIYDKNRFYTEEYRQQIYNYTIKIEEVT